MLSTLLTQQVTAPVSFALSGASGAFGRTLLGQALRCEYVEPVVLCDLNLPALQELCIELGYPADRLRTAASAAELKQARADGRIALLADIGLLAEADFDVLVEATGNPAVGTHAAESCIVGGRHVVMVSKEVDNVSGPFLGAAARDRGVSYLLAHGDQPANLLDLVAWARLTGLEIVAVGKAGEYDLVYDRADGTLRQADQVIAVQPGEIEPLLTLGEDPGRTLIARESLAAAFKRSAAADLSEMAAVATRLDVVPECPTLGYPIARIDELADVYTLMADAGDDSPVKIDVFSSLRLAGEASIAGGVFVIVRTTDPATWQILRAKGHVVSQDGRFACIYWPYHLMGVETVETILLAARGLTFDPPRARVVMAARATRVLESGTRLTMGGHHHEIEGAAPLLLTADEAPIGIAPFYLAANARLARRVEPGDLVLLEDLADPDPRLVEVWRASSSPTA